VFPYALTIFLSAFLLFQIQPLMGKYLLPWFGGTPAVWTTCMLFFQTVLLLGYGYGHGLAKRWSARNQRWLHLAMLMLVLAWLLACLASWKIPLLPGQPWKPHEADLPTLDVLILLAMSIGLPYLILSATSPLIQFWYNQAFPGRSPYRLYSLSNLGSMLGLLTYPILVEPVFGLSWQARLWTILFFLFAGFSAYCCLKSTRQQKIDSRSSQIPLSATPAAHEAERNDRPGWPRQLYWMLLAALPSLLLLATTNQICQEVAVIPFLWVLPLSLYLLSFVLCFDSEKWHRRNLFQALLLLAVCLSLVALFGGMRIGIFWQILFYSTVSFAAAMVCHAELVRLKPEPRHLTLFYRWVAAGGAMGGVFSAIIAPRIFAGFWELHFGLILVSFLVWILLWRDRSSWVYRHASWPAGVGFVLVGIVAQAIFQKGFNRAPFAAVMQAAGSWLNIGVAAFLCLSVFAAWKGTTRFRFLSSWLSLGLLGFTCLLIAALLLLQIRDTRMGSRRMIRNFYGVLTLLEENAEDPEQHLFRLRHGRITHGLQYQSAEKRHWRTAYFGVQSGFGLAIHALRQQEISTVPSPGLRIGFIGLGVGTMAAYAASGDYLRIYEINPAVVELSTAPQPPFTYFKDCPASKDIVLGDARLSLEQELEQNQKQEFDLFAIDAFNSDSIPVHLLTREAMGIYLQHLKPTGVVAFHITNQYLDLKPVVYGLAAYYHLLKVSISTHGNSLTWNSDWVLLSRDETLLKDPVIWGLSQSHPAASRPNLLWTDDFSNLLYCLK
jgi:hypothetical protein